MCKCNSVRASEKGVRLLRQKLLWNSHVFSNNEDLLCRFSPKEDSVERKDAEAPNSDLR